MVVRILCLLFTLCLTACATHQDLLAPKETGPLQNVNHPWEASSKKDGEQ